MNYSHFFDPSATFCGMPFWSLNDCLDPAEMSRQVEEFHRAGMGGFFLHSRIGLITEYLGAEWMEALGAAIEKAAELGLEAWLYDEDKWPSGYAGGRVPVENPEYRGQYLGRLPTSAILPENSEIVFEKDGWVYFTAICPLGIIWFNGTSYTDLMNPEAVATYIRSTHEKYKEHFGKYFGTVIPGIFTDEPIMRMRAGWGPCDCEWIPYSPYLLKRYQATYGESPFPHIEKLFTNAPDSAKYRYRYWKMASEQFVEAYTKQVAEWCEENNLKLTGHFMYEDSVEEQSRWIGNAMAHYEYMQIPGIDHLGLNIDNMLTAKQCSSQANQQGKKTVLSEMYGCSGQNLTFEDRKWVFGWHAAMGINFICHHLSLYSNRGCRKRDYPPTFSWQQPYWQEHSAIENWQARLSYVLRQGQFSAGFLLLHPVESGWCLQCGNEADNSLQKLDAVLAELIQEMFKQQHSFDLGNEDFMARFAKVKNKKFIVGEMQYRAVIIPEMFTIRETTLQLLEEFKREGGQIFSCGKMPQLIDAKPGNVAERLKKISIQAKDVKDLTEMLEKILLKQNSFTGRNLQQVLLHKRQIEEDEIFIMFNSSRHEEAQIELKEQGLQYLELDLDNGEKRLIKEATITLAPAQTKVILLSQEKSLPLLPVVTKAVSKALTIQGPWNISYTAANTLLLDFAQWSFDAINWQAEEPCIALKLRLDEEQYQGPLYLRHSFVNKMTDQTPVFFRAELPAGSEILVNKQKFSTYNGSFLSQEMLECDITSALATGLNTIEFKLNFVYADPGCYNNAARRLGTELESAFITGDFAVYGEPVEVGTLPKQISHDIWSTELPARRVTRLRGPLYITDSVMQTSGELTLAGLPFYSGTVKLSKEFNLPHLDFTKISFKYLDAITARVKLNGQEVKHLFSSRPLQADIKGMLQKGNNLIEIELRNSLRNLLGPHHHTMGELCSVGPYSFISRDFQEGKFVPEKNWSKAENRIKQESWTDDYFFVKFGLPNGIELLKF